MSPSQREPSRGSDKRDRDSAEAPEKGAGARRISMLEWIIAAVGLVLVVGVVAFLLVEASRNDGRPPDLSARIDSVTVVGDSGYLVQFTAENGSRTTAAEVGIVGTIGEGPDAEEARASLDYVPGRSVRRGGLLFRGDPRGGKVKLRVEGYREP